MKVYTKNYKELLIWRRGHELVKCLFVILRKIKIDDISNTIKKQIIRSVTSVPANIVEGYYTRSGKQFVSYLERSRGSLGETEYWLLLLSEENHITMESYEKFSKEIHELILMISSLIHSIKTKSLNSKF